jgi:AmmeMemoRadiSam system protein A/AmmeMemoRadiSam system protein B
MVPEVGGKAIEEVRASIDAMHELTERLISSGAETLVLISPHAPLEPRAFVAYQGDTLKGSFASFRAPETEIEVALDKELLSAITVIAMGQGYKIVRISGHELDHGTTVPLYFFKRNGWTGKVVSLGYTFLSNQDHVRFGTCIRTAADLQARPVALVASGDLSHRLKVNAPAGYHEDAHLFDDEVVSAIKASDPDRIVNIDSNLRSRAGECGYRSMLVAIGASEDLPRNCEVLSYEAPFGVGYMVAQLMTETSEVSQNEVTEAFEDSALRNKNLPGLARQAVESFIRDGLQIKPELSGEPVRAACFVSIKTVGGELRGCVGTIEPVKETLEEELIANAINAATHDPRFPCVTPGELINLKYSVDVLSNLEPTVFQELDPEIYGVVVEEEHGRRRGVLLPKIEGVGSAEQQVAIAMRKAGITPGVPVKFFRFRVSRYRESNED